MSKAAAAMSASNLCLLHLKVGSLLVACLPLPLVGYELAARLSSMVNSAVAFEGILNNFAFLAMFAIGVAAIVKLIRIGLNANNFPTNALIILAVATLSLLLVAALVHNPKAMTTVLVISSVVLVATVGMSLLDYLEVSRRAVVESFYHDEPASANPYQQTR